MQRAVLHYPSVPEAIQLILAQFKSVTKEIGLINVLTRLVEAVTAVDKVPASLAPRVRSIAARHHADARDNAPPLTATTARLQAMELAATKETRRNDAAVAASRGWLAGLARGQMHHGRPIGRGRGAGN